MEMKNKSAEYWRERYKRIEERLYKYAYDNKEEIEKIFNNSLANINKEIAVWLQRFADNNNITYTEATRLIGTKELEELDWNVEEYVKKGKENSLVRLWDKELENASAKFHVSRLEALKIQIINICDNMFGSVDSLIDSTLKEIYTEGYYGSAYELSKGLNVGINVAKINENLLNYIIHKPWSDDGVEFSERIWGKYRPKLVNRLHKDLTDCVIRGINPKTLAAEYAEEFRVSKNSAANLLMTEYSQFASMSNTDCLRDLGVEEYEIIETLDGRTCGKCQGMDKKHFPMAQLQVGVNAPPFHNRCRGTKCPYINDEFGTNIKRAARDPETEKTVYVDDMSYAEWKDKFVKEKGQETWDYYEKSTKNKSDDKEQYEKYKAVLGKNAPKTLEEFQEIKYNGNEIWNQFKAYTNSIKSGELTPLADFSLYKSKCLEVSNTIIGITTANGIKIENRTNHLIARVIGSVENKRSGVEVADILRALKEPSYIKPIKYLVNGPSQKFVLNGVCIASINPDTKTIIQVNPFTRKKGS